MLGFNLYSVSFHAFRMSHTEVIIYNLVYIECLVGNTHTHTHLYIVTMKGYTECPADKIYMTNDDEGQNVH